MSTNNTKCLQCNKAFYKKPALKKRTGKSFCSRDCYFSYRYPSKKVPRSCEHCGVDFFYDRTEQRFCGRECAVAVPRGKSPGGARITLGNYDGSTIHHRDVMRRLALERDAGMCVTPGCGLAGEWLGKKLTMQVDHIDGDNTNNKLSNLRTMCPNCHTQTETYAKPKSRV